MANVKFSRKAFEKEIGKLTDEMQEKIAMLGCTVESLTDDEIELEIFPNRPDMLSFHGFKRSFLGFLGKKTGLVKYKINKPEKNYEIKIDSSVKSVRPCTSCAIVKGLKFDDEKIKEVIDLQEKLHLTVGRRRKKLAIGIYPLEKITLPITYKAEIPDKIKFFPLESNREMTGLEILQRHPAGKEYSHLLAGKVKFPLFLDAKGEVLSMPPIINSEFAGRVDEKTHDIFVECSGFDEKILDKCLNIIVSTFSDMGGKIYSMKVGKRITPDFSSEKMKIKVENVNKILGLELSEKEIKGFLEKMGYSYNKGEVMIPAYRTDVLGEIDLIEDIAIAYGYENFEPLIPKISTVGEIDKKEIVKKKISEVLIGLGLIETSSYHLTKKEDLFSKMGYNEKQEKNYVKINGSKTDYNSLRTNLKHYILKIFSENLDSEYPQKIFEMGRVFEDDVKKIVEREKLSIGVTPGNFTDVLQILNYLFYNLDVKFELKEQEKSDVYFVEGRGADILVDDVKIGEIGEIHPKILRNWKIKMPVSLLEIDLEKVFEKF